MLTTSQIVSIQGRGTNVVVSGVSVSPTSASIATGATQQLTATVAPANATNKTVSWSSSNTGVATVNSSGLVTGVAAGTATITVTTQDGNKTATSVITITSSTVAVTGVSVSPTSATISISSTQQLTATVAPTNATNKTVSWSSSNTGVATVNSSGLVTGVAAGTATITVTTQNGNKTATSVITVTSGGTGAYYVYSDAGNNFTPDGGTIFNYVMTVTNFTSGAPEGTNYRKIAVAGNYATYEFQYPSAKNKSSWSSSSIYFSIRTTQDFDFFMEDFAGNRVDVPLSNYMTKSGNWELVSIPVSVFSGVNLSQLMGFGFYRTWNASINMDFDNLRISTSSGGRLASGSTGNSGTKILEENPFKDLAIYPNPTTGPITLNLGQHNGAKISIYDLSGKAILTRETTLKVEKVDLTGSKGLILIRVFLNNKTYTKKIIVE